MSAIINLAASVARVEAVVSPVPRESWWRIYHADRQALVTQSPAWTDAVCQYGRFQDASRLYHFADGRQMVLPLIRQNNWLPYGGSMPTHWGYGGLLSADPLLPTDVQQMWQDLATLGWQHIRIRPNPLQADVWDNGRIPTVYANTKHAHILHLNQTFDTVWQKKFSSTTRRNVRKAEKSGVTIECDTTGRLLPTFYKLFQLSIQRWATQQNEPQRLAAWRSQQRDPITKFETIVNTMQENSQLWVAWYQGEAAAALLVLQGHNAHYTRGVMDKTLANQTRANELLHAMAIKNACENGCQTYHMGETGQSVSLAKFKEKFGAEPYPYAEYFTERLPLTKIESTVKHLIKSIIGFKDA